MSVFVRRNPADADLDAVGVERRDLAVIAIRGTLDVHDARRDLRSIVMGGYPGAFVLTAAEIVRMYQCQGCQVMVTGHSLGGYLAEVLATTLGLGGAAFCAPGPGAHNGPSDGRNFAVVNHEADTIGNHNHHFHVTTPVYIMDGGALLFPWTAHRMDKMVQYMQKRQDWTNLNFRERCLAEPPSQIPQICAGLRSKRD
ncbi:unnamed protein product [Effrenium voratum]|nr:unnamed protein product [Effrenium voratum]